MTEPVLYFYTTSACELCERAEQILQTLPLERPLMVEVVDIAESEALVETYGTRIPVLRLEPAGEELGWPFTPQDVIMFLNNSIP